VATSGGSWKLEVRSEKLEVGSGRAKLEGKKKRDLCERTFQFALRIVNLCQELSKKPGAGQTLAKQLLRSGTSIGANVEEGQAGQSKADFVSKYSIACKEARETHYWLRLMAESGIVSYDQTKELLAECDELIAILTTIIKKVKAAIYEGRKKG